MVYRVRNDCSAIQQQAYWCEPSEKNVKRELRKDLETAIQGKLK
jgi:hypothetical protein